MSKLSQLQEFRRWRLPTPAFRAIDYSAYHRGDWSSGSLRFPLAVRSTFQAEDGAEQSMAGHFSSFLNVGRDQLPEAIGKVFSSYPYPEGQQVILQEMAPVELSGVLFAFREGVWKAELVAGAAGLAVAGQGKPESLLLPRFGRFDDWLSRWWPVWDGYPGPVQRRALIRLSRYAGFLLKRMDAPHGLDIEFAISGSRLYLLQARPITTPEEAEVLLTTANHREILPSRPSRLMAAVITRSGEALFDYYRRLDPSLPAVSFIVGAAGMPWINLSALLDMMVHWGLPSRLVAQSVGADDPYRSGLRPWRLLRRLPVFVRALAQQWRCRHRVESWLSTLPSVLAQQAQQRDAMWRQDPAAAGQRWVDDFSRLYVQLVTHMQALTGAMAGPVSMLDRLGWLPRMADLLEAQSKSTDYLEAFREMQAGLRSRADFLRQFGNRGFYESDIGQARFREFSEQQWEKLLAGGGTVPVSPSRRQPGNNGLRRLILQRVALLIHTRERLRHEVMEAFWLFREELQRQCRPFFPDINTIWAFEPAELLAVLGGERSPVPPPDYPARSGWDMDTFLCNRLGRRLSLDRLSNPAEAPDTGQTGIGIFPGKLRGQIWRVETAGIDQLQPPPFRPVILLADALDPGWIPFFSKVDGVISFTGGLLSHASIILRESRIPAITQLPRQKDLQTGDWIEMDGSTGEVRKL